MVQLLDNNCFADCVSLACVEFEQFSLLQIVNPYAFSNCALTEIKLPRRLERLGHHSFAGCRALASVRFLWPTRLKVIGNQAFAGSVLLEVTIPSSLSIHASTFPPNCTVLSRDDNPWEEYNDEVVYLDDYNKVGRLASHVFQYQSKMTGRLVAARQAWITDSMQSPHSLDELFRRELESWKRISSHPSIVPLFGYSLPGEKTGANIITEFLEDGSLHDVISNPPEWWNATAKATAIVGFVRGMEYVHSHGLIHRDLTPRNLLFDSEHLLRINDFKSSRTESIRVHYTRLPGNGSYTAPEMPVGGGYDSKVDVFSFGMILYEILSGQPVFAPNLTPNLVMTKVMEEQRPDIPPKVQKWTADVIRHCWSSNPQHRPSFHDIALEMVAHRYQFESDISVDVDQMARLDNRYRV
jgi:serine/threonine protein kinase